MESLERRGFVELITFTGGRRWVASLTDKGEPVAREYQTYRPAKQIDPVTATGQVSTELFKKHPEYGLESVYERVDVHSFSRFVDSVKSWCKDKTELSGAVIDAADYRELYADFCTYEGREPVWEEQPELPGVVLPEDPAEAERVSDAMREHFSRPTVRLEDIPGLLRDDRE